MGITVKKFWQLFTESNLYSERRCESLKEKFDTSRDPNEPISAKSVSNWLVKHKQLTPYQVKIFLAGRSGPFVYGDFKVYDRLKQPHCDGNYRAVHGPSKHKVGLAFASGDLAQDPRRWLQLVAQTRQHRQVIDAQLIRCFSAVDTGNYRFVAIDDPKGDSLRDKIRVEGAMDLKLACRTARTVASAMQAIHAAGQVHGDVRTLNVIGKRRSIRLYRDPLRFVSSIRFETRSNDVDWDDQVNYLAPELTFDGAEPNRQSDIYALGCVFHELLTGKPPFPEGTNEEKFEQHRTTLMELPTQFGIPEKLGQLVSEMLAKNPADRISDVAEVIRRLEGVTRSSEPDVVDKPGPTLLAFESSADQYDAELLQQDQAPPQIVAETSVSDDGSADSEPTPFAPVLTPAAPKVDTDLDGPPISVIVDPRHASLAQRHRPATNPGLGKLIAIVLGLLFLAGSAYLVFQFGSGADVVSETEQPKQEHDVGGANNGEGDLPPSVDQGVDSDEAAPVVSLVPDDGVTLWEAPTEGEPISLDYLPAGLRAVMTVRLAELLGLPDARLAIEGLGPQVAVRVTELEKRLGFAFSDIEQLTIGLHDDEGNRPQPSFRVRLSEPASEKELAAKWGVEPSQSATTDAYTLFHRQDGWSYLVSRVDQEEDSNEVIWFLFARRADVAQVVEMSGAPPLLQQGFRQILRFSDDRRHVNLAVIPNALFNEEGQRLFEGQLKVLAEPLDWLLGDSVQAATFSLHFDEECYVELMLKGQIDVDPKEQTTEIRQRFSEIPDRLESYLSTINRHPYWSTVQLRLYSWTSSLQRNARYGDEDRITIVNCWLPGSAAHNLIVAGELIVASATGAEFIADDSTTTEVTTPNSLVRLLNARLSTVDIPQNDLVLAVADIEQQVLDEYPDLPFEFKIQLMGNDLRIDGITQNQAVRDFLLEAPTLSELLTGLVVVANPDPNSTGARDPLNKLVWALASDPKNPGNQIILITTRAASAEKGYTLPDVFRPLP